MVTDWLMVPYMELFVTFSMEEALHVLGTLATLIGHNTEDN